MSSDMIFVSYSRQDKHFVDRLTNDLRQAGFNIWRDTENLVVGTPNWERAIRDAIKQSAGIILVASPSALQSDYVQGELMVGKLLNRPIYPIWATGDIWIDCVPLDMANYQYVDGREKFYENNLYKFTEILGNLRSTETLEIILPSHNTVKVPIKSFRTLQDFLDTAYVQYGIHNWFDVFTYGLDWVLADIDTYQIILPLNQLPHLRTKDISKSYSNWKNIPLSQVDIRKGMRLAVWPISVLAIAGFAVKSEDIKTKLMSKYSLRELSLLVKENKLQSEASLKAPSYQNYPYTFVLGLPDYQAWDDIHADERTKFFFEA